MLNNIQRHEVLPPKENKTRTNVDTLDQGNSCVISNKHNLDESPGISRCGFVLPEGWCGARVEPGSAYCALHRALCEPPEDFEEDDADRLAGLDLPRPAPGSAE
jgi:hypothetical protein